MNQWAGASAPVVVPAGAAAVARPPWMLRRWRDLIGVGGRIIGLDIARGIAVLGMVAVHTNAIAYEFQWFDPATWSELAWGNASATFAVLAGVAVAIIAGRTRILDGAPLVQARVRILVRAALIFVVGGIIVTFNTSLVVIIEFYAVFFAMTLPFLRMPWWGLAATGLGWILVMPPVRLVLEQQVQQGGLTGSAIVDFTITGFYPALTWFGYTLVGMAIGRLPLDRWSVQLAMLGAGIGAIAVGSLVPLALIPILRPLLDRAGGIDADALLSPEGHTGSAFDLLSSTGVALVLIALCLLSQRWVRWVLFPIAAVGSMSLTAYTAHAIAFLIAGDVMTEPWAWVQLSSGIVIGCTLWRLVLPKGPLEWVLSAVSRAASDVRPHAAGPIPS